MALKMVDLARTPDEVKAEQTLSPVNPDADKYPWGMTLSFDDATLKKLDMTDLPQAGTELDLVCRARVTRQEITDTEGGGKRCSMTVQVTAIAVEDESAEAEERLSSAQKLYGSKGAA